MTTASRTEKQGRDQRGVSVSTFVVVVFAALVIVAGLVVDGGQKVSATRRAESVAVAAARVGTDAGATSSVAGGGIDSVQAYAAASAYLRGTPDVTWTVRINGGRVIVTTDVEEPTIFLSVLGIRSVTGHGESVHELRSGR